jgi:hypothetical protein
LVGETLVDHTQEESSGLSDESQYQYHSCNISRQRVFQCFDLTIKISDSK